MSESKNELNIICDDIYSAIKSDGKRCIYIPVNNIQEYNDLIELAMHQTAELNKTISLLKSFEVEMKITF